MSPNVMPRRTLELREYVGLYKWSVLAIVLVATTAFLAMSRQQTPTYVSDTEVLVRPVSTGSEESSVNVETEKTLALSRAVAERVAEDLSAEGPKVDPGALQDDLEVELIEDTEILSLQYTHADPETARDRSQAFATGYLTFRRSDLEAAAESRVNILEEEIEILEDRLALINRRIDQTSDPSTASRLEGQATTLLNALLESELQKAEISDIPSVGAIVSPATTPRTPTSPNHVVNGVFGLIVGLGLGLGYAAFRARREDRILDQDELESYLEVPVLATVPQIGGWRGRSLLFNDPDAARHVSEAFRILRTNLLAITTPQGSRSVVVTSALPGEGKTTTAANLAIVIARSGRQVVLISADLRHQRLSHMLERPETPGLTDVLWGRATLDGALADTDIANLKFLPGGTTPDDPAQLLGSSAMVQILEELGKHAQVIVIDGGPVLGMADTLALAPLVDAVLMVVDGRKASYGQLIRARRQLTQVAANVFGAVPIARRKNSLMFDWFSLLTTTRRRAIKV